MQFIDYKKHHIIRLGILILALVSTSILRSQVCTLNDVPANLRNGLVTLLPFCNNLLDISTTPSNFTINNVTLGADRFGNPNSAALFTRANASYLFTPANSKFEPPSFTISLWFKTNIILTGGGPGDKDQSIFSYSPINWFKANAAYGIELNTVDNSSIQTNMWTPITFNQYITSASGTINNTNWFHVALVYDNSTKTQKLYINGSLFASRTSEINYDNQSGICIGSTNQTGTGQFGAFFDGLIDDVAFWNRALDDCEILQVYNNFSQQKIPTASIKYPGSPFCQIGFASVNKIGTDGGVYSSTAGLDINETSGIIDLQKSNIGTYTVTYTVGKGSCSASTETTVVIKEYPGASNINGLNEFCKGNSIKIRADGIPPFQWYRSGVLIPGEINAELTVIQPGDYNVSSRIPGSCIVTSFTKTIIENPLPVGSILSPLSPIICDGNSKVLEATGGASYQWYLNLLPISSATFSTFSAKLSGTYSVDLISDKGCTQQASNSITLSLIKKPIAQFSYDSYCINSPVTFISQSNILNSGSVSLLWKLDDSYNFNGTLVKHTFSKKGTYKMVHYVIPQACPQLIDSINKSINIEEPLQGISYLPVNVFKNKPFVLSARNFGSTYLWTPNNFLNNPQLRTPVVNTNKEQLYQIYITQSSGCVTIDTQLVRVFNESEIYVPKGFTPDNDGNNDRLYPILVGIQEMRYFKIFNRWGNLIYDNKNANLNNGWDGTYKGAKLPTETYVWIAEGIDIDGKIISRNGNTILIR